MFCCISSITITTITVNLLLPEYSHTPNIKHVVTTMTTHVQWSGEHEALVTTCHISPEQDLVVSGTDDGTYCYWDTRTGKMIDKINGK